MANPVTRRRPVLGAAALVLLAAAGCSAARPREEQRLARTREAVVRAADRMREHIARGEVTGEVERLCRSLKLMPRSVVVPTLIQSLRPGHDEFNAVVIDLVDELGGADWVPVRFRARTATLQAAVRLLRLGADRADQAAVFLDRITARCDRHPAELIRTWMGLLESAPIVLSDRGRKADLTARVQGLAVLGLIRTGRRFDLGSLLDRVRRGKCTAPPSVLSQCLVHWGGEHLKRNLLAYLGGPPAARAAAAQAVDCLRLRPPREADAARVAEAAAYVRRLGDGATWQQVILAELRTLVARAARPPVTGETTRRLNRARTLLGLSTKTNLLRWLGAQPPADRNRALERLAGIDLLVSPPPRRDPR